MAYSASELYSMRRRKYNEINTHTNNINRLEDEIERLERAHTSLKNLKNGDAKQLVEDTKVKNATKGYSWRGKNKNNFDEIFETEINSEAKRFRNDIDDMMEEISSAKWSKYWKVVGEKSKRTRCYSSIAWINWQLSLID